MLYLLKCQDANLAHVELMKIYDFAFYQACQIVSKKSKRQEVVYCWSKKSKQTELRFYKQKVRSPTVKNISKYKIYLSIYAKCVQAAEQQYQKDLIDSKKQNVTGWKICGPVINPGKSKRKGSISKLINEHTVMTTTTL